MTSRALSCPLPVVLALAAALALRAGPAAAQEKPACRYVEAARVPLHYTGPGLDITMDGVIDGTPALMRIAKAALDKRDAGALPAKARDDKKLAQARTCQAMAYIAEWRAARGEKAESAAQLASMWAQCPRPAAKQETPARTDQAQSQDSNGPDGATRRICPMSNAT